jgi:hypothetical protein
MTARKRAARPRVDGTLHGLQLRPAWPRRERRHAPVRRSARDRGPRGAHREAGGSPHVFGASSGGALALEAAATGLRINGLAVHEVPYNMDEDGPHLNRVKFQELLAGGHRGDVIQMFSADGRVVRGVHRRREGVTVLARPGDLGAHTRVRRGVHRRWFAAHRPFEDHAANLGGNRTREPRFARERIAT